MTGIPPEVASISGLFTALTYLLFCIGFLIAFYIGVNEVEVINSSTVLY